MRGMYEIMSIMVLPMTTMFARSTLLMRGSSSS
jgi:hypothetical protein